jgi:hypothetical protein
MQRAKSVRAAGAQISPGLSHVVVVAFVLQLTATLLHAGMIGGAGGERTTGVQRPCVKLSGEMVSEATQGPPPQAGIASVAVQEPSQPGGALKKMWDAPAALPGQLAELVLRISGSVQEPTGGSQAQMPQESAGATRSMPS